MTTNSQWNAPPVYEAPTRHTTLTPYLQLSHLLSLTWLAYPILSLLFVAFRLQLSEAAAADAAANAKEDLLASCKAAETAATSAASMPRYLAVASNAQIVDAVNGTLNAARATLVLALTIMEVIINFIIDIYRSTFLCFLELVVRGGLSIILGAVKEFNNFLSSTFSSLRTSIQNDIQSANSVIQSAINGINKVNPFGDINAPQISVPSLDALQNVTLPSDFQDALQKLNDSLPTVAQLKDKVESIIDKPFELLKKDINDTFAGISFNSSTLPIPQQNNVLFCDQMDTSVVDNLKTDLIKITKIGTVILVLLALLLLAANCTLEWYKWRCMKRHLQYTREAWTSDPTLVYAGSKSAPTINMSDHNLLMLQASSQHPLLTKIANRMQALLRLSPSQHIHVQWFFHYVFHPPALACFLIGFFGLLSVQVQLLAISPLAHKYSEQAVTSANDFSNTIATSVNNSMYNQSASYANDVNTRVDAIQSTINDGLFGWVNGTTTTLNDTINAFYTDIQDAVNTVFNGTILDEPVQEFIRCFIGTKVDAIENALTFLHDNLHVDIPRVNDTVLVLSPADVNEVTRPVALAAIGGGEGNNDGVVGRLVSAYVSSLKKERIMFGIFMGLWFFVVLMALSIIFWHAYGRDWRDAYKRRKWQKTQRSGPDGFVVPFRDGMAGNTADANGDPEKKSTEELHSFPPIPPPKVGFFSSIRSPSFQNKEPHPLSTRNPEYQKSWDDLLDQANSNSGAPPSTGGRFKISSPMNLVPLRRTRTGHNDSDSNPNLVQDGVQGGSLWLRVQGLFRKRDNAEPQVESPEILERESSERARPILTIDPSANANDPPMHERKNSLEQPVPSSAWSVSPGPAPKVTWLKKTSLSVPFQPKSRRTVSVPSDIQSVRDSMNPNVDMQFPVPLHHGFERPVPSTPPPADSPLYNTSFQTRLSPPPRHPRIGASAPPVRPVDPFVTPFDDEYSVNAASPLDASPVMASSERRHTNPFVTTAI